MTRRHLKIATGAKIKGLTSVFNKLHREYTSNIRYVTCKIDTHFRIEFSRTPPFDMY
jgi:hypothetical protein